MIEYFIIVIWYILYENIWHTYLLVFVKYSYYIGNIITIKYLLIIYNTHSEYFCWKYTKKASIYYIYFSSIIFSPNYLVSATLVAGLALNSIYRILFNYDHPTHIIFNYISFLVFLFCYFFLFTLSLLILLPLFLLS